jgi:hypothetical protein
MQKYQNGFAHIILVILLLFVCTTVGLAAVYVFVRDKTTILEGGYSWSTMKTRSIQRQSYVPDEH